MSLMTSIVCKHTLTITTLSLLPHFHYCHTLTIATVSQDWHVAVAQRGYEYPAVCVTEEGAAEGRLLGVVTAEDTDFGTDR